ncbi:MAG: histidine kinase, partial [Gemmatimonadota bacterium]
MSEPIRSEPAPAPPTTAETSFAELVRTRERGKLKLYIGSAAGTGKTFRMLTEAHLLRKRGIDVVVGFIETHGRIETEAQLGDLEIVPRRRITYRGVVLEEMDTDAVVARRPQIAIVDELAHTNVPGTARAKRWEDVVALLDEGINVISAVNVQHLESLNDVIQNTLGVTVRETIPDWVITLADQVVNLDISAEDLRQRLIEGKIYTPDKVQTALKSFFTEENLATLRELALREVAGAV